MIIISSFMIAWIREIVIIGSSLIVIVVGTYFVRAGAMTDQTFGTLFVTVVVLLVLFFAMTKPPKPRKPPRHPLPAHELLHLFLRVRRPRGDSWHF